MSRPVVTVNALGKTYWLYPTMGRRLLGCFVNPLRVGGHAFRALSGLTFELQPGEAIALIGKNGAGKSTALQVLAGITPPTEGGFQINGRVCALLELGSGFNPEFTGRQNIALAGILLGLTREQVKQEEENIIRFADIGEFIDQPVKFYSSGMFVRLAFAVAVAGTPNLLIVDEALAVGDIFFRQKCYARLREMRERGMAVILVTHSSSDAQEFCDRAILLEHGRQAYIGDPKEAMLRYYFSQQNPNAGCGQTVLPLPVPKPDMTVTRCPWPELERHFFPVDPERITCAPGAMLEGYCLTDENNLPTAAFEQGRTIRIYTKYRLERPVEVVATSVSLWTASGVVVYCQGTNSLECNAPGVANLPATVWSCHEIVLNTAPGEYVIGSGLADIMAATYSRREYCDYNDWKAGCTHLADAYHLAAITVVLPFSRTPSRVTAFGLVDLPAKAFLVLQR